MLSFDGYGYNSCYGSQSFLNVYLIKIEKVYKKDYTWKFFSSK